jgi:hypothetical protein
VRLRDLDERFLPDLARRLDDLLRRLPTPPEPAGPAPLVVRLRRVDDRWTRRGPLALLREVPQLGAVLLTLLLLVGAVTIRLRPHHHGSRTEAGQQPDESAAPDPDDPGGGHLGPQLGDDVATYVAAARARLASAAAGAPDGTALAVVSFKTYQTPEQAAALLGRLDPRRVFFRAPLALTIAGTHDAPVNDLAPDTHRAAVRVAAGLEAEAQELLRLNRTIADNDPQKPAQARDAANHLREAKLLRKPCACVYAVVVRTRLRLLTDLLAQPAVRVVDPSPANATADAFTFSGLLPEERKTVTGGNQAG